MRRSFDVPEFYRSEVVSGIKRLRQVADPKKRDRTPSQLEFGTFTALVARHFGFCFGVENAIEIAYQALEQNQDKRVFLLSEIIHNQHVNKDLAEKGIRFLQDTLGNWVIPLSELTAEDIVIVPAFGTTLEVQSKLEAIGIDPYKYDSTCPFVEKVWKRSYELGNKGFSVVVHGKRDHEETRATFSHSRSKAPTVVVRDMADTKKLCKYITGELEPELFYNDFGLCCSKGFDPSEHLQRLGVINQTTMLASETKEIAEEIKKAVTSTYGPENFADTRDTLCYATYENQEATLALLECSLDVALVVGGFNSSNTSHLVELLEEKVPTFYIRGKKDIHSLESISHFSLKKKQEVSTSKWFPAVKNPVVAITAGASCPDALVDEVIRKVAELTESKISLEDAASTYV